MIPIDAKRVPGREWFDVRFVPGPVLLCCVLLLPLLSCDGSGGQPPAPSEIVRPVKTLTVKTLGGVSEIELLGEIRASERVDLAFEGVSGQLVELPIAGREGQQVMKGELLAEIDSRGFESALNSAARSYEDALSVMELARTEKERMEEMKAINPDLVSASMLERTRKKLDQAEARVKSLEAKWEQAEDRIENASLRAPFAGVIVQCHVNEIREVQEDELIVSLRDTSRVDVLADVPEALAARVRDKGLDAITAVARLPVVPGETFPLEVRETAPSADPATGTYRMVLEMPRPEGVDGLPGMALNLTLTATDGGVVEDRFAIPAIAVLIDPDGKSYVWVVDSDDMLVHRRDVELGRLGGTDSVEILSGLEAGEPIVVAGVLQLTEGQRVRLWEGRAPGTVK